MLRRRRRLRYESAGRLPGAGCVALDRRERRAFELAVLRLACALAHDRDAAARRRPDDAAARPVLAASEQHTKHDIHLHVRKRRADAAADAAAEGDPRVGVGQFVEEAVRVEALWMGEEVG